LRFRWSSESKYVKVRMDETGGRSSRIPGTDAIEKLKQRYNQVAGERQQRMKELHAELRSIENVERQLWPIIASQSLGATARNPNPQLGPSTSAVGTSDAGTERHFQKNKEQWTNSGSRFAQFTNMKLGFVGHCGVLNKGVALSVMEGTRLMTLADRLGRRHHYSR
ncbi:hypothetical protein TGCAST_388490, partial [Toxoplasma gondii CAST]